MTVSEKSWAGHAAALVTILIWGTTFISTKVLLTDFLPALNLITDLIAMIAMTVGFVMVLRFFATARPGNG